jgi:hypothetical protein
MWVNISSGHRMHMWAVYSSLWVFRCTYYSCIHALKLFTTYKGKYVSNYNTLAGDATNWKISVQITVEICLETVLCKYMYNYCGNLLLMQEKIVEKIFQSNPAPNRKLESMIQWSALILKFINQIWLVGIIEGLFFSFSNSIVRYCAFIVFSLHP